MEDLIKKIRAFYKSHPLIGAIIMMFIVAVVLIWLLMIFLDFWTHHGEDSTVPEIKNMTYQEAAKTVRAAELDIEISDSIYDTSVAPGTIVESWPKAGSQVKKGRKVYVTLTAFSPKHITISMPITGVSSRQAVSYLNAMGVNAVRIVNVPSEYVDLVEGAHYDGRPIGVGSVIPVDAKVVLEVGYHSAEDSLEEFSEFDEILPDETAEQSVLEDLSAGHSVYIDDEP